MKKIKFHFIIICIFIYTSIFSQNQFQDRNQAFIVGFNGLNDSFTSDYAVLNEKSWNFNSAFYIGYVVSLNNYLNLYAQITNNKYKAGQIVNDNFLSENGNVSSLDVMVQYDISSLVKNERSLTFKFIKPFVTVGFGVTTLDVAITDIAHNDRGTFNYGIGGNIWLGSLYQEKCNCNNSNKFLYNFGFTSQIIGKSSFDQDYIGNKIQLLFGLIYRY